ncbi:BAR domain-containing protein [Entomophthora muscae]|uniref:BAR domain-containing protein n=1 Tax=Entomophthora muscae TaxID=34485 RepID=A0ACC2UBM9_9FUNG|nr:BAR domain-containing protein [Entomophthora muscae]
MSEHRQPPNSVPTLAKQSSLSATNKTSPTPYHEMAVTFANCGLEMGVEEPTGSVLYKVATIQQKIGDAKLIMDQHIATDFVQALNVNLNTNIRYIEKARRDVDSLFNTLHIIKERHASAGDEPGPELEFQLNTAQSNYDKALDVTTQLMTTILNSPDTIKTISELVKAQLTYHQEAHQLLSDIFPQVNDMAAAQIALQSLSPELLTEVNTPDSKTANMSHCSSSERYSSILSPTISHDVEAKEMDPVSSLVMEPEEQAPEQPSDTKSKPESLYAISETKPEEAALEQPSDTNTKPEPLEVISETKPIFKSSSSSQEVTPTLSQSQTPEKV